MTPCPHCGADVGDASPAYCPSCRGPLLGQRSEGVEVPPPGVEFDRSRVVAEEVLPSMLILWDRWHRRRGEAPAERVGEPAGPPHGSPRSAS